MSLPQDSNTPEARPINAGFLRIIGVVLILGAAIAIRLYPVLVTPEKIRNGFGPFGDSFLYHKIAYNLYKGNGYSAIDNGSAFGQPQPDMKIVYEPAVARGPVYPAFLASVYALLGDASAMESADRWRVNWDRVRIVQAVLDALICGLLFWALRALYPDRYFPAILAAALYSVSFYNIFYTRMLLSESITTFLVTLAIVAAVMAFKSGRLIFWFINGVALGLASLSKPEYILFPFFLSGFVFFVRRRKVKGALKATAFMAFGLLLVITPWALRNYLTYKQVVFTSIGALGLNLFIGTFEGEDWQGWGKWPDRVFKSPEMKEEVTAWRKNLKYHLRLGTIGLKAYDVKFQSLALNTIRENPLRCFTVWIKRLPRLWYQDYIKMYAYREPSGIWFMIYFLSSISALALMTPEIRIACAPIVLLFIYLNLVCLPLHIEPRYGVTIYPGLNLLTALGICLLASKIRAKWWPERPTLKNAKPHIS